MGAPVLFRLIAQGADAFMFGRVLKLLPMRVAVKTRLLSTKYPIS